MHTHLARGLLAAALLAAGLAAHAASMLPAPAPEAVGQIKHMLAASAAGAPDLAAADLPGRASFSTASASGGGLATVFGFAGDSSAPASQGAPVPDVASSPAPVRTPDAAPGAPPLPVPEPGTWVLLACGLGLLLLARTGRARAPRRTGRAPRYS